MRKLLALAMLLATAPLVAQTTISGVVDLSGVVSIGSSSGTPTAAQPTDSPGAGTYSSAQTVTLTTSTGAAAICYTEDGTTPTATAGTCTNGTTYTGGFTISSTTTLKAIASESGYNNSSVLTSVYTISGGGTATIILCPTGYGSQEGNNANCTQGGTYGSVTIPHALQFGDQGTNTASMAIPITVNNCSNVAISQCSGSGASVNVTSMSISGTNASDFVLSGTTTGSISGGQYLNPSITFTPTASAGTAETATLTEVDSTGTHTMALTGTSATVTTLSSSSCPMALSANTNYQLTSDIACGGSAFTDTVTHVDLNLNGHTLTYCNSDEPAVLTAYSTSGTTITLTASNNFVAGDVVTFTVSAGPTFLNAFTTTVLSSGLSSSQFEVIYSSSETGSGSATGTVGILVGAVYANGFNQNYLTVHNGQVLHGAGVCSGTALGVSFGSGAFIPSSSGSASGLGNVSLYNLNITTGVASVGGDPNAKVLQIEGGSATVHDVNYASYNQTPCPSVGCRSQNQGYPFMADNHGQTTGTPPSYYNISGVGGTQGAISDSAVGVVMVNNFVSPGNTVSTLSNGFAFQDWGNNAFVEDNLVTGSGPGGSAISTRGIQVANPNSGGNLNGSTINGDWLIVSQLANDSEYGGCQLGGGYGMQLNFGASNNTFTGNHVVSIADACPGIGFSYSNPGNTDGPNYTVDNHFECDLASGSTASPCAGANFDAKEYSPAPDGSMIATGDTYLGDTSALYIGYDGTSSWKCNQCTFGKGTNPISGWLLLDNDKGLASGNTSSLFTLVDPIFTGGATKSANNLSNWANNNPTLSSSYIIEWTYTVTVEQSSNSAPISGATVAITPANSGTPCSTTTNGSGVATCILPDTLYQAVSGTYSTPSYNPMAITISATGCTTLGPISETITATTNETKKLGGC